MPAFDIIHTLIFGHDLPYLVKAIDPFTLAIIAQTVASGIKGFRDKEEAKEIQQKGEEAFDEYSDKLLEVAKREQKVAQGEYDLFETQKAATEAQRKLNEDLARRAEGTLLRDVNLRANPNVAQQIAELNRNVQVANTGLNQQDLAARTRLLDKEQSVADANFNRLFDMESFLYGTGLERGAASAEAGRQQGIEAGNLLIDTIPDALTSYGNLQGIPRSDGGDDGGDDDENSTKEKGGIVKAKAGAAFVTPGEFSHDTNPQNVRAEDGAMVFENKRGEDIAEVTGQEIIVTDKGEEEGVVVIDPNTAVSMEELVAKGDKEGLFKFFKNFFMKKKQEQEEHEAMKEQMQEENV
jgi:hypothetical protein